MLAFSAFSTRKKSVNLKMTDCIPLRVVARENRAKPAKFGRRGSTIFIHILQGRRKRGGQGGHGPPTF